jgi:uncharacterized delta-60 repeat protein
VTESPSGGIKAALELPVIPPRRALELISVLFLVLAAAYGQSALDGFDPNPNGPVLVVVVQPDGKILIGGGFTTLSPNGGPAVARNRIARLNPDGTLDTAFDPNATGYVLSIALQADGKILAGGGFTTIGGQTRNYIARLDATTGLADSFDPNANDWINSIVVQADGKILAGGSFNGPNSIGGQTRNHIARLDATTGGADSFDPNANGFVAAIVVQADGNILACGGFSGATSIGGQTRNRIARLDATTGLADSFDPNANSYVYSIAVQADGKILVGGEFINIGGQTRNRIARLETDGRADQTLDVTTIDNYLIATAVQPDGKILIGGNFRSVLGAIRNFIARLNSDGTLDTAFNPNATGQVLSIVVQPDGKILVGGDFRGAYSIGGQSRNAMARLDPATGLADSFDPNVDNTVWSLAVQTDGKIVVGGSFAGVGGQTRNNVARIDGTTGLPDSFNPNANGGVNSIAVQADGKILAGGNFTSIGGQSRNYIARLDAATGLADSFDPNANSTVLAMAVQPDGRILAGGFFVSIGGQTRNALARLDPTTGLADSFDPNVIYSPNVAGEIESIAVQADGKILAGGVFTSVGGQPRNDLARLDATTGLADSFNPNANRNVTSIALQADGKILAGGFFTVIGGQPRGLFARLANDTAALQDVAVTRTTITWARGGSSPPFTRATFEFSTDNVNYAFLVNGISASGNWTVTNLSLPTGTNFYIRARGHYRSGGYNGSESIAESVRNVFLAGPPPTATPTATPTPTPTATPIATATATATPTVTPSATATVTPTATPSVIPTATPTASPTFTPTATPAATATVAPTATATGTPIATPTGTPTATPTASPGQLGNISTRVRVETGNNVLIGGFIVTGTQLKRVIVRAIGPSLNSAGVLGALANPILELRDSSGLLIASNDNWMDAVNRQEIIDSSLAPTNNLESAILMTLPASNSAYTAIVRGVNDGTGVGLVEAYDLDRTVDSRLANISTRGSVQTGNDVMIGGFIVVGQTSQRVIVRAIGPSLPVSGKLADPILELHDSNGALLQSNDNWRTGGQEAEIIATGIPPSDDLESAIVRTLPAGSYTAIVRGVNGTTGVALVEVYALN